MVMATDIDIKRAKGREAASRWYCAHKETLANNKRWRDTNKEYNLVRTWRQRLLRNFGMTPEDYAAMLSAQGGVCLICKNKCKRGRLAVDHSHETGRVRGLLCRQCNINLGHVEKLLRQLPSLLSYLESFK